MSLLSAHYPFQGISGAPVLHDGSISTQPLPEQLLLVRSADKTPVYASRLYRVNGELRASKDRNVIMSPYIPQVGCVDPQLEEASAKITPADDIEDFLSA